MIQTSLKVYLAEAGIFYVARWWTHNEQHQLLISRSEASLKKIIPSICEKYSDAKIDSVYEVELVAPSILMCQKAAIRDREKAVSSFVDEVCCSMHEVIRAGQKLPKQFSHCLSYKTDVDDDYYPDSIALKWHVDCINCHHGFVLVGITAEQLYDRYNVIWNSQQNSNEYTSNYYMALSSKAQPASDDEDIWIAVANFGHHCNGIEFKLIKAQDNPPCGDVLFYFRMKRNINPSPYQLIIDNIRDEEKRLEEINKKLRKKKEAQEELEKAQKIVGVFAS